jgi:hypothetical protein
VTLPEDLRKKIEGKLLSDEKIIWTGRAGWGNLNLVVNAVFAAVLFAIAYMSTWGSFSNARDFCEGVGGSSGFRHCFPVFWFAVPAMLLVFSSAFMFAIEKWVVDAGGANAFTILTDRRLLRVSTWLWFEMNGFGYRETVPKIAGPGRLDFGEKGRFNLHYSDLKAVLRLIHEQRETA